MTSQDSRKFYYPFKKHNDDVSNEKNRTALEEFLNSLAFTTEGPIGGGGHLSGSGPPINSIGFIGDIYIDTASGIFYFKDTDGVWKSFADMASQVELDALQLLVEGRVRWRDEWVQQTYESDDMVRDGAYTMIANKQTNDKPAPAPAGALTWLVPDNPVWNPLQYTGMVFAGVRVLPPADRFFEMSEFRVWLPNVSPDAHYQVVIIDLITGLFEISTVFDGDILPVPGWLAVNVDPQFISEGDDFVIGLATANSAADTLYNHPWVYEGTSQTATPAAGNWNRDNQHLIVRISKTDDDATDRSAELAAVIPGSIIRPTSEADLGAFWEYETVGAGIDQGTYYEFNVTLVSSGGAGPPVAQRCQVYFEVPVPLPADYVELVNHWAASPNLQGYIQFDSILGGTLNEDAYGVDVQLQEFTASDDWDLVAIAGGAGGGGGEAPITLQQLESWPTGPTFLAGNYSVLGNVLTIPAGRGVIMDSYSDPENIPIITGLDWSEQTIDFGVVLTRHTSFVYIDSSGIVQFDIVSPDAALWRQRLYLGRIFHDVSDGSLGAEFRPWHAVPNQISNTLFDFIRAAGGAFLFNGGEVDTKYPDLTYALTESQWFSPGESWYQDRDDPNIANNPALDPAVFSYMLSDGTVFAADTTLVDPASYESAPGIVSAIPAPPFNSTIQRLYAFINGEFIMTYGQEVYASVEDAVNNLAHDIQTFVPPVYIEDDGQVALIAYFIMEQGATDLSDGADVIVINDERLPIGGGGGHVHTHDASYLALSGGVMAGDINMDDGTPADLYGLANPPPQLTSAVSLDYLNDTQGLYLPLTGGSMSGAITMTGAAGVRSLLGVNMIAGENLDQSIDVRGATTGGARLQLFGGASGLASHAYFDAELHNIRTVAGDLLMQMSTGVISALRRIDLGGTNKVTSVLDPTDPQDVATKAYVDANIGVGPFLPLSGGTLTGLVTFFGTQLGTLKTNSSKPLQMQVNDGNVTYLEMRAYRHTDGSNHSTSLGMLNRKVDSTWMGGLAIGSTFAELYFQSTAASVWDDNRTWFRAESQTLRTNALSFNWYEPGQTSMRFREGGTGPGFSITRLAPSGNFAMYDYSAGNYAMEYILTIGMNMKIQNPDSSVARNIQVSTAAPIGGIDGDVWMRFA